MHLFDNLVTMWVSAIAVTIGIVIIEHNFGLRLFRVSYGFYVLWACLLWPFAIAVWLHVVAGWIQPGMILRWILGYVPGMFIATPFIDWFEDGPLRGRSYRACVVLTCFPWGVYILTSVLLWLLWK